MCPARRIVTNEKSLSGAAATWYVVTYPAGGLPSRLSVETYLITTGCDRAPLSWAAPSVRQSRRARGERREGGGRTRVRGRVLEGQANPSPRPPRVLLAECSARLEG